MTIELSKAAREAAQSSIERYFEEAFAQSLGNMESAALLDFMLTEIGPFIYNGAVRDLQDRMQQRVAELDIECHA